MSVAQAPVGDPRAAFLAEIGSVRQRIWMERAGVLVTRGLMLGFLLTLILALGGWWMRVNVPPLWYAVPLLVPMLLALLVSLFFYPSMQTAARIVDKRLELAEQLATAGEIVAEGTDEPVAQLQVATAAEAAVWAQQNWRGGPKLGRDLAMTAVLGFLAAAALLLTGPEGRNLMPRPPGAPQEQTAQPAASPEPVASKPQQPKPQAQPSPQPQQTGRTAGVQRAVQDVQRSREAGAIDAGEASRRLGQAEAELGRLTQQSRNDQQALDRLASALDQIAAGHEAADALRRGNYEEAARAISELGTESDQLSQEAKNQLAQALRQAANDSASSPELSQAERRAADALAGRDYEAASRAMSDLADQVQTRSRNVIPQAEQNRAWDTVNQERRAQGQPDSAGSAQGQQQQQGQGQGQQGRQQQQQGQQGQQGQSQQPQDGQGGGTAPSNGGPPGEQQAGDPAPRLEAQGKPVEVELKPNEKSGARPGDADEEDNRPRDDAGAISSSSSAAPGQVTSSAPAEMNFVPSGRRDIVREYFQGPGEARPQQ